MKKVRRILVTAGPTREWFDPVRFISNPSTGEMGYALAREGARRGYRVTLLSGPTALRSPRHVRVVPFVTVDELDRAVRQFLKKSDALIMTAAVGDYKPSIVRSSKMKRSRGMLVRLVSTQDVLKKAAGRKRGRVVVGFCLETERPLENAQRKLQDKKLDVIVANFYGRQQNPFGKNKASVFILDDQNRVVRTQSLSKTRIASKLLDFLEKHHFRK